MIDIAEAINANDFELGRDILKIDEGIKKSSVDLLSDMKRFA